jgi:hypothetical protein
MSGLFKEGGPMNIQSTGDETYSASVPLPKDDSGRLGRECTDDGCSPAYFKVLPGTGITENHEIAYCPYCRSSDSPNKFFTEEQVRYAKEMLLGEAVGGIQDMMRSALGLGPNGKRKLGGGFLSIEMSLKTSPRQPVRRPFEEEVRRDLVCPHCGLDHSVYGLAVWCPDCGKDIFVTHVAAEVAVVRAMLNDVPRRRDLLGRRVAAKDIENCLEDTVSIMEAVLRALSRRALVKSGKSDAEVDELFKKIGNAFQNVDRTCSILLEDFQLELRDAVSSSELDNLKSTFEKRHPITHNLGVIDKKYLQKTKTDEDEGKEVLVSEDEIGSTLDSLLSISAFVHGRLFPNS